MSASDTVVSVTSPVLVALSVYAIVLPTLGDALSTSFVSDIPGSDTVTLTVASAGEPVSVGVDDV